MTNPTLGAALYFEPVEAGPIPTAWLDEALRLLAQSSIPIHEASMSGAPDFVPKGAVPFPASETVIRAGLASGSAESVYLHGHPTRRNNLVLRCRATAGFSRNSGYSYLVVPERPGLTFSDLLLATHALTRLAAPCRYGIAYRRSAHLSPSLYARGMLGESLEAPDKEDLETGDRIFRFVDEINRTRRHLRGGFRSIYPAQLLSEAHRQVRLVTGETVAELKFGTWTAVEDGLWLWELEGSELMEAKALFEVSGLLLAA
jgi:hypothetical protein